MKRIFVFLLVLSMSILTTGISFADGVFDEGHICYIQTKVSGRFLSADQSITTRYLGRQNPGDWKLEEIGDGLYYIKSKKQNKYLYYNVNKRSVSLGALKDIRSFEWKIHDVDGFYIYIKNMSNGMCLASKNEKITKVSNNPDVKYHSKDVSKGKVILEKYTGSDEQKWHICDAKRGPSEYLVTPHLGFLPSQNKFVYLNLKNQLSDLTLEIIGPEAMEIEMTYEGQIWGQHIYVADITNITNEGKYQAKALNKQVTFEISRDIYEEIKGPFGTLTYEDFFRGFWDYQRTEPVKLRIAELVKNINPVIGKHRAKFNLTDDYITIQGYDWKDAHSRDSKVSRFAGTLINLSLAAINESVEEDKETLVEEIKYGVEHLLEIQAEDGSFPLGKVRDRINTPGDQYNWCINKDTGVSIKCVRALALAYQLINEEDGVYGDRIWESAEKGFEYIEEHHAKEYFNKEILQRENWSSATIDFLGAALEMAIASDNNEYLDVVEDIFTKGQYVEGIWTKEEGQYPATYSKDLDELDAGSVISLCRYYDFADDEAVKNDIKEELINYRDYWETKCITPYKVPMFLNNFGQMARYCNISTSMLYIHKTLHDEKAKNLALQSWSFISGSNPFNNTFIVGLGKENKLFMFKRHFEGGIGALLPGIRYNKAEDRIFITNQEYQSTEGMILLSSDFLNTYSMLRNLE